MIFRTLLLRARAAASEAFNIAQRVMAPSDVGDHQIDAMQLESRILYSASPLAAALPAEQIEPLPDLPDDGASLIQDADPEQSDELNPRDLVDGAGHPASDRNSRFELELLQNEKSPDVPVLSLDQTETREIVFIDAAVSDYEQLVNDLKTSDESRTLEVVLLESSRDGIEQITETLSQYGDLTALHIVSHGREGAVKLGDSWLNVDTLNHYAGEITDWRDGLSDGADVLFYGCDLAANEDGRSLLDALGALCDCDVAASDDDTGQAARGGDWELEYAIGAVETDIPFTHSVRLNWQGLLMPSSAGIAIWREDSTSNPEFNEWDGVSFGDQGNADNLGEWRVIQGAEAPTRNEAIVLGVDEGGDVEGQIWDGSNWTGIPLNPLGIVAETFWWSVDVRYESQSGDAIIVWADNSDLKSATWDGTTWSGVTTVHTFSGEVPRQIQLAADPNSDEMVVAVSTSGNTEQAWVWDGDNWGNTVILESLLASDATEIYATYESLSGDAMVVYDSQPVGTQLEYRIWNGSTWSGPTSISPPVGITGDADWAVLASDPSSDRIALAALTENSEIWFSVWDGTTWTDSLIASTAAATTVAPTLAVAFESSSGDLLATYGEVSSMVRYRTWASGSGWSGEALAPSIGSIPNSMTLSSDPNNDNIMLSVQDDSNDLHYIEWNGDAWGIDHELEIDTGEIQNQPFLFLYDQDKQISQLNATQDTWLSDVNQTFNYGAATSLVVDKSGGGIGDGRALLQFDLSTFPGGVTFTSARLALEATAVSGPLSIELYEVTESWDEGAGDGTNDEANWNNRTTSETWSTAGGEFDGTDIDTFDATAPGTHVWELTSLVQDWYDGTKVNNGLILGDPDTGTETATYDSSEGTTPPVLIVAYTVTNFAPTISLPAASVNYSEGDGAVIIDATATADDANGGNLDGGQLTVDLTIGGTTNDRIAIRNEGTGAGQIGISGADVTYEGTPIGTWTGGTDGFIPLVVTFNTSSSPVSAEALMRNITFENVSEDPDTSTRTVRFVLTDGDGGTSNSETETINVFAVNDAPTLSSFAGVIDTTNEDTEVELTLTELRAQGDEADVDGSVDAFVVKSITSGTLRIGTSAITAMPWSAGSNDTIDGANQGYWTPDMDANGTLSAFEAVAEDDMAAESVGNVTAQVSVTPVNDAPTLSSFAGVIDTTNEDTEVELTLTELRAQGDEADVDGSVDAFVVQSITSGTLRIGTSAIMAMPWSAGSNDTIDSINQGYWTPDMDANGTLSAFEVVAEDDMGAQSVGNVTAQVSVTPVNDVPINTVPSTSTVAEEMQTTIAGIAVTDVDAAPGNITTRLRVTAGVIQVSPVGAATISAGANDSNDLTILGTLADVNATLTSVLYTGNTDVTGTAADTLTILTDDGGNTGVAGPQQDFDGVDIDITPVNDAPVNIIPGGQTTDEDTPLTFSAGMGNSITVSDVDAGNNPVTVTLTATNGTVTLGGTTGLTFGLGDGVADSTMMFVGTISEINNALEGTRFDPDPNFFGLATIQIAVDDRGNVGSGGALVDLDTIDMTVLSINDQPTANADAFSVDNNATLQIDAPGLLANDTDVDGDSLSVVLVSGPGAGTLTVEIDGAFTYRADPVFSGVDSFVYIVSDGTTVSPPATVTILVNAAVGPAPFPDPGDRAEDNTENDSESDGEDDEEGNESLPVIDLVGPPKVLQQRPAVTSPSRFHSQEQSLFADEESDPEKTDLGPRQDLVDVQFASRSVRGSQQRPQRSVQQATSNIVTSPLPEALDTTYVFNDLDSLVEELKDQEFAVELVAGTSIIITGAMSVGFVLWVARTSYFMTLFSSTAPVWLVVDPIPVLDEEALSRLADSGGHQVSKSLADLIDETHPSVPVTCNVLNDRLD